MVNQTDREMKINPIDIKLNGFVTITINQQAESMGTVLESKYKTSTRVTS